MEAGQGATRSGAAGLQRAPAALLKTIFAQESKADAEAQWAIVADALREKQPKLGALMDASRDDVLAYMSFLRRVHSFMPRTSYSPHMQKAPEHPPRRLYQRLSESSSGAQGGTFQL